MFDRIVDYAGYLLWLAVFALGGYLVGEHDGWYWGALVALGPPAVFLAWCWYGRSEA